MTKLETLAMNLYRARREAKAARKRRAQARKDAGECSYEQYPNEGPCWLEKPETWCEACAKVLPHYEAYHKAANRAAAALRSVLAEGRFLSEENE